MSKPLIAFLLVVVAIFVFTSTRRQPQDDSFKKWLGNHKTSFDRTPRVRLQEVHCPQIKDDTLVLTGLRTVTCTIDPEKGTPSRKLKFVPNTPGRFRIGFTPAEGEPVILPIPERDLDPKNPPEILVGEKGGKIVVTQPPSVALATIKLE